MNVEERDLLGQFSAYVKTAITRTRKEYLRKHMGIRSMEFPLFEDEEVEEMVETGDILRQVDLMSQNMDNEVLEIQLLMDQISSSVVFQAVSSLDKQKKEILLLRIFYMKSFEEIGEMLGITSKQAENTYFNAIRKIRRIIGGGKNGI